MQPINACVYHSVEKMPPYPGLRHTMEVLTGEGMENANNDAEEDDAEDWGAQYQAYLDEQELERDDASTRNEPAKKDEAEALEGDDWAIQYAKHCEEKEREFFEQNRIKEE